MPVGSWVIVLHAHLPYVRHPEHPDFLEEDWFFEAMTETYLPLVQAFERLASDGVNFRVTMSLTPPLCEMMADPLLQERYLGHLGRLIELVERETGRLSGTGFEESAWMYRERLHRAREEFAGRHNRNLVHAFRELQEAGFLEVVTCGATHGFLPLMATREAQRAQIRVAAANYRKHFGRGPRGIWLAECAYAPGVEEHLAESEIRYFFLDTHGVVFGSPRPKYGVFRPVFTPAGVAAFGRDVESSRQVWSSKEGYPGDYEYREFYRDLGYDGEYESVKPALHSDGVRRSIGIKYHRITGEVDLHDKGPYRPGIARERAAEHAGNFMFNRQQQMRHLRGLLGTEPLLVSPYDAELFGHWWYEGPEFIEFLLRKLHYDQDEIRLVTPSEYLAENETLQVIRPSTSSWGDKGYMEVWLNGANDWIYRHLHKAEERMLELARANRSASGLTRRALNQAARELLLAQSSDWAFIMTTGTDLAYAEKRTRDHLHRFNGIYLQVTENRLEEPWIAELESRDNIFGEIDYRAYL